ncbi:hypothetical protein V1477_010772, partial [Vespula maculifrons]
IANINLFCVSLSLQFSKLGKRMTRSRAAMSNFGEHRTSKQPRAIRTVKQAKQGRDIGYALVLKGNIQVLGKSRNNGEGRCWELQLDGGGGGERERERIRGVQLLSGDNERRRGGVLGGGGGGGGGGWLEEGRLTAIRRILHSGKELIKDFQREKKTDSSLYVARSLLIQRTVDPT